MSSDPPPAPKPKAAKSSKGLSGASAGSARGAAALARRLGAVGRKLAARGPSTCRLLRKILSNCRIWKKKGRERDAAASAVLQAEILPDDFRSDQTPPVPQPPVAQPPVALPPVAPPPVAQPPVAQPPVTQPPVAPPPVTQPPVAPPPVAQPPVAPPPVAHPPVAQSPVAQSPTLEAQTPLAGTTAGSPSFDRVTTPKRELHARLQQALAHVRSGSFRRWLTPAALLLVTLIIGLSLLADLRGTVWTYYTDEQGTEAEVNDERTRYVLWQDPEAHTFEEPSPPGKKDGEEKTASPSPNSPGNQLEAAFSPDGTRMIIVRAGEPDGQADLYVSNWNGRIWSRPVPFAALNTPGNERGPAFSRDGRHVYFSSDRPGGSGGYDLYVASRGKKGWQVQSLGPGVNSAEDENGPAVSSDDNKLYFSSNRQEARQEDIFFAERIRSEEGKEAPSFRKAEPVDHLNSNEQDVQAALTRRGEHVFLASDRDSTGRQGYGVYFSRVVKGKALKPERVDLYIEDGNVTDPAVRMDGFDLLFSSDHEAASTADGESYRLYRSTTREVVGYTDLSRWAQFKDLLGTIGWWILLALAALIALIYLLESWRDISSLFHKCLAGSAAAHLLLLIIFAALVIVKEIEQQSTPPSEVVVTIDAMSEEELALESVPEESEMAQPDLAPEAEKAAAAFDIPEFKPQEDAQDVPIDAEFQQEAMEVEVQAAAAETTEEIAEPTDPSALLAELSEAELPEPDQPLLDEREFAEAPEAANPTDSEFAPTEPVPAAERSEPEAVADAAVDTPAEAAEIEPSETLTNTPTPLAEITPALAEASLSEVTESLQSELLAAIPESAPLETEPVELEEITPSENNNPADPSDETFDPAEALPATTSNETHSGSPDDAPTESPAEASEVAGGAVEATQVTAGPASPVGEASSESQSPETLSESSPSRDLPEAALIDPGIPELDEGEPEPANAPADPATDDFNPSGALAESPTAPAEGAPLSDAAVPDRADAAEVSGGAVARAEPAPSPSSPVGEARAEEAVPEAEVESGLSSSLPETDLLDPGSPELDEGEPNPADQPPNPEAGTFDPAAAMAATATTPMESGPVSGAAVPDQAETAEVGSGAVTPAEPAPGPSSAVGEARAEESVPDAQLESGLNSDLAETPLLDPGAPQLDEGEPQPEGASGSETFTPEASSELTSKEGSSASTGAAESSQAESSEVGQAQMAAAEANEGSAEAIGEARSEEGLPSGETGLASALPESPSLLDPGSPDLEEGPGVTAGETGNESFRPDRGSMASSKAADAGSNSGGAASDQLESESISGGGLVAGNVNLTGPQDGLEAGGSETVTAPGPLGAASLEPTLTGSLLPGKLDTPAGANVSDFLKKQRGRPAMDVIQQLGGSDATEKAIRASMRWLAQNQEEDGRWDSRKHGAKGRFDTGNTGLALLCFFGWGARHDRDGEYRDHVNRALDYLLRIQKKDGDLSGDGHMYCHSTASIALCEAYGITGDQRLREPAERSIAYTLAAQSKSRGGWRYNPGEDSDTSITGWQYMALHSARLAGLKVPEKHFELARKWLDFAGGGKHGGLYGYQGPGTKWPAMIATGMFCRQLDLVPPTSPMQIESAQQLKSRPMRTTRPDYYYIYYATLALYQHQGPVWNDWNEQLKEVLPRLQEKTGRNEGSWAFSRGITATGGRVASTALATLSLEVYYRILPLYGFRGNEESAPERKFREETEDQGDD